MSMYNHADGAVQFPATRVYNAPGQGCTTAATYSPTKNIFMLSPRPNWTKQFRPKAMPHSAMKVHVAPQ